MSTGVVIKSNLPLEEVAVCGRLREIRLELKWGQPDFAKELGVSRERLASYEYAKAPVRYWLGNRLCERFDFNQRWLATGMLPKRFYIDIHAYFEEQIPEKMLFREAYSRFLSNIIDERLKRLAQSLHCSERDIDPKTQRIGVGEKIGILAEFLRAYHERLIEWRLSNQPEHVQRDIFRKLNLVLDELLPGMPSSDPSPDEKNMSCQERLDTSMAIADTAHVQKQIRSLDELRRRLRMITKPRGAKAALARHFKVSRQAVDQWLSGESSPSAEIAIQLQYWKPELKK